MKSENKIILLVLSCLATAIATVYWKDITFTLPAALPLGSVIIIIFVISMLFTDAWRLRTEHIIYTEGHQSIRQKDLIFLPWQESTYDKNKQHPFNEMLVVCLSGGIDFWGISLGGPIDAPILIFPSRYLLKEGSNFHCLAHLDMIPFRQLPLYIQDYLISLTKVGETKHRIDFKDTPIYYGNLSKIDGSLTATNAATERKFKLQNEESSYYEQTINRLYNIKGKEKDFDKKEIIIASPLKRRDEQQDEEQ
ncbi:MAG: hypothetical protein IMZ52_09575 [Actinobacteria bacterium]|nr:hypothetical protein [Bacteroidota bacterium]MBE3095267.1 hypothetical protein [Actinomycetota bacterium]